MAGLVILVVSVIRLEWNNSLRYPLGVTLVAYFIVGFVIFGFREPMIWFLLGTYEACQLKQKEQLALLHKYSMGDAHANARQVYENSINM